MRSHREGKAIAANRVAAWGDFFLVVDARLRRMMTTLKVPRNCKEDVGQEVWAAITQKLLDCQEMQPFWVWLYKVAGNKKADAIRHMVRRRCESLEGIGKKLLDGKAVDGAAWLNGKEQREWLVAQLSKEDPETVRLLLDHFIEGKKFKELAAEVGKTEKAIESRIGRLRKRVIELASKAFPNGAAGC